MTELETSARDAAATEGEPVPDIYFLETVEQVKVLGDPLRYRMALLLAQPMTCAGLARALKLTRPKAHYHLKQLESVGVVRPHSQALSNGIVEKFYVTAGRMLHFGKLMPRDGKLPENVSPETVGAISAFLAAMLQVSGIAPAPSPSRRGWKTAITSISRRGCRAAISRMSAPG